MAISERTDDELKPWTDPGSELPEYEDVSSMMIVSGNPGDPSRGR